LGLKNLEQFELNDFWNSRLTAVGLFIEAGFAYIDAGNIYKEIGQTELSEKAHHNAIMAFSKSR